MRGSYPSCSPGRSLLLLVLFVGMLPATAAAQSSFSADHFSAMQARAIGPAGMSGRVASVAVCPADGNVIYVGAATGGVWKSQDGGLSWQPVFDRQGTASIGAVTVHPANPDLVWVGTGEGNPRNSQGVGRGIWKSLDGGSSWTFMGLGSSEHIHRVVVHPDDPDRAWVAALGPTWSPGGERGIYRTDDGGRSWQRVLSTNEQSGAADLVIDPRNPDKLFAAMWEHRRWPWFFVSGGEGSGLFVTRDGGDSWERLGPEEGLPEGPLGRIGLAVYRRDPRIVYALVEAEESALLRSEDGGRSWRVVNDQRRIAPRPFYYADIRVDPQNENRVYNLHSRIEVSEDAGRTFRTVVSSSIIHGDVHELWIDAGDPRHMIMGNDGGIAVTWDRGEHWRFVENLPLAQFYHVTVDDELPYNVYGGMQDNGSWFGPSDVWASRGISNAHWTRVGGGDGFHVADDPSSPRYGWSMSQGGALMRFDRLTGGRSYVQPADPDSVELRFNWNTGFASDPFRPGTVYLGSQFVHRSSDGGASWERISPDLTTDDEAKQIYEQSGGLTRDATGAENHTTIVSISPSPIEQGMIWVGTDDGRIAYTRDDGLSWAHVEEAVRGVPDSMWVPHVEPSPHEATDAWVVFDDHRRGNMATYLFRTEDLGRRWERVPTEGVEGFAHVVRQDPEVPSLLYLGTEYGLWVSLDGGRAWMKWTHGLPTVPVRDLAIQRREGDLVVGTHGRAAYVIDDLEPLRTAARTAGREMPEVHMFEPPRAWQHEVAEAPGYRSYGHAMFYGESAPYGALLSFWSTREGEEAELYITGSEGDTVRALRAGTSAGVNRVVWDLQRSAAGDPADPDRLFRGRGPEVPPATYTVHLRVGTRFAETALRVDLDPREDVGPRVLVERYRLARDVDRLNAVLGEARTRTVRSRQALEEVRRHLRSAGEELSAALRRQVEEATGALEEADSALAEAYDEVRTLYYRMRGSRNPVSGADRQQLEAARTAVREALAPYNALGEVLEPVRRDLGPLGAALIPIPGRLSVGWAR